MTLVEGSIRITLPANCRGARFDGDAHRLTHCMKAVDFIIDTPSARIFLEIKDPDAAGDNQISAAYAEKLESGSLDRELYYKYRDSWLYFFGLGRVSRPSYFFVLLGLDSISVESISGRSLNLGRKVSLHGPSGPWPSPFVDQCFVFNLDTWNRNFPELRAERI